MNEIKTKELKEIQLNILKEFTKFCDENGILYYLYGGTLLGAIRHKGYIPWDDDIDIALPRIDYERLIKLFNKNKLSNLKLLSNKVDRDYPFSMSKIIDKRTVLIEEGELKYQSGVCIDVFVLDATSNNYDYSVKDFKTVDKLSKMLFIKTSEIRKTRRLYKNLVLILAKVLLIFTNYRNLIKKIDLIATKYEYGTTKYVGIYASQYKIKSRVPISIFSEYVYANFEGYKFKIPVGADDWLSSIYGEYLLLPPKDKRVSHHSFIAYWKE